MTHTARRFAPLIFSVLVFVVWEIVCRGFRISDFILPAPSAIFAAIWDFRAPLLDNAWQTLWTTLIGLGLAIVVGCLLGCALGVSTLVHRTVSPMLVAFNSVPKAAFVPILVVWFGIGSIPAILTAFLISFFPIVVNIATGLTTLEPELEDVLRALGASRIDILRKVGFPRALPYFFSGLKVAVTLAFVGAVLSEISASNSGIGYLMMSASSSLRTPLVFAGVFVISAMSMLLYYACVLLEARMTRWARRGNH
jgi:NitT/TauT family transport system permease protein